MEDKDTTMQDTQHLEDEENNLDQNPNREGNVDGAKKDMLELEEIPDADSSVDSSEQFDNESVRFALAKMFIIDELPFNLVERQGFRGFMSVLEPRFQLPSRIALIKDCIQIHLDERLKLKRFLSSVGSRICLSAKRWTSLQNLSYLCLTAHFMDDNWKLHRKILNFYLIPGNKGEDIGSIVQASIRHWGIQNVGTFTVENSIPYDVAAKYLKDNFHKQNYLLFGGEFFHIRCSANILNLIVRDCLDEMQTSVARIRDAIMYVRSSTIGAKRFKKCIMKEQIPSSRSPIYLDVETRWSSTYFMLNSALKFQRAFEMLQGDDPEFLEYLDHGAPTIDDWNNARVLIKFLKMFYDASKSLSGSYVTSSSYIVQVCHILSTLDEWAKSSESQLQSMALKMKGSFNKYWGRIDETNLLLLISMALDPRCKVTGVRFYLTKVYPAESEKVDSLVNQVTDVIKKLFDYYKKIDSTSLDESAKAQDDSQVEDDFRMGFKKFCEEQERAQRELELQRYLVEGCEIVGVNDDFNIISWWKMYSNKYRVLSKIAKDLLSIPVSTLDSKSACSFGDQSLGEFQSSLPPAILGSLICTKSWLEDSPSRAEFEEDLEELEKLDFVTKSVENGWAPFSSQEWPFQ